MRVRYSSKGFGRQTGSILIVCFFVLVMLSMFAITVGYTMRQKLQVLSRLDTRQKLRLIGDAGVQKAIYVLLQTRERPSPHDALGQSWSSNESGFKDVEVGDGQFSASYAPELSSGKIHSQGDTQRYGLIDEERKLNINLIKPREILQRFFEEAGGMSKDEAKSLVDAIRDWKDEDDDVSDLGAESRYYKGLTPAYLPRNGAFATLAELRWVKGMTPEIYEKVRPYITLNSSGQINLNTASEAVLMALGFSSNLCDKIVAYRNGRDQLEGTEDDKAFDDLSSVAQSLANANYLNDNDRSNLDAVIRSGVLTVKSQYFTAQVFARLKHKTQSLRVVAVFDEKGVIKRWEEAFVIT